MMNNFRRIFCPTEEEIEEDKKRLEQITQELLVSREALTFVQCDKTPELYHSEPFHGFIGDCCSCSHYLDPNRGFITGGDCLLHKCGCGDGFTCKDNDSKYAVDIK